MAKKMPIKRQTAEQMAAAAEADNINAAAEDIPVQQKIGEKEVRKAEEILRKYKAGKAHLEKKLIANEQFWKLRQWEYINRDEHNFTPASAWLWSCIESKYADIMDGFPTCNFLPRQQDDQAEATKLSNIVPIIMDQCDYEDTYSKTALYILKQGGAVQGIFWDASKHNGLGDISIKNIDWISLFTEPGIKDIQDSTHVFYCELVDNDKLNQMYPQTVGRLNGKKTTLSKYIYDDQIDTTNKSCVVDWYYHTYQGSKKILQFCKFVEGIVLYATENETERPKETRIDGPTGLPVEIEVGPSMAETGLYAHGLYPFCTTSLYEIEGSLCGMGLVDIAKDTQLVIDRLNKAIVDNAVIGSTPRYFVRDDGTINEAEYADLTKHFVHVEGNVGDEKIRPVDHAGLDGIYVNFLMQKIDELKYITANQDANNGVAPSGVTSASGIAALMEQGGKNSRSINKTMYRLYREVVYQVVELIRQFYDLPRTFRLIPDGMQQEFIDYNNAGLQGQPQIVGGQDMGLRKPEFDIEVTAEKQNPYKKMEINDLALQFYNAGFFNPQMAQQALSCLNMMDFARKDDVVREIEKNGTLQEQLLIYQQMALTLAQQVDPALAEQIGAQIMGQAPGSQIPAQYASLDDVGKENKGEHPFVQRAREHARETTQAE